MSIPADARAGGRERASVVGSGFVSKDPLHARRAPALRRRRRLALHAGLPLFADAAVARRVVDAQAALVGWPTNVGFGDLLELPDFGGGEGDVLVVEDLFLR